MKLHSSPSLARQILSSTCVCLVHTQGQGPRSSLILCPQLLFLLQVGDEAGFAHLAPYSWGKTYVEGRLCRGPPLPIVWGQCFGLQCSEDGQV